MEARWRMLRGYLTRPCSGQRPRAAGPPYGRPRGMVGAYRLLASPSRRRL